MYACMYVCTGIYIYVYVCMCVHAYVYVCVCIRTVYMCMYTYINPALPIAQTKLGNNK